MYNEETVQDYFQEQVQIDDIILDTRTYGVQIHQAAGRWNHGRPLRRPYGPAKDGALERRIPEAIAIKEHDGLPRLCCVVMAR